MDYEMKPHIVYIKTDDQNRIRAVDSSVFLCDTDCWIEIDSGYGDKYAHAQGNYFPQPIYDHRGICYYLYTPDGETLWRERTQDEMDADYVEPVPPTDEKQLEIDELKQQVAALSAAMLDL